MSTRPNKHLLHCLRLVPNQCNGRYILLAQLFPENSEEYMEYLVSIDRLADVVNQEEFVSKEGKSNHQVNMLTLWEIEYLVSIDRLDEAAVRFADVVNQEEFVSKEGKSNHQVSMLT